MGDGVVVSGTTVVTTGVVKTSVKVVIAVAGVVLMADFGVAWGSVLTTAVEVVAGVSRIGITVIPSMCFMIPIHL